MSADIDTAKTPLPKGHFDIDIPLNSGWHFVPKEYLSPEGHALVEFQQIEPLSMAQLHAYKQDMARRSQRNKASRVVPKHVLDEIKQDMDAGKTDYAIAKSLNAAEVPTAQGGKKWYPGTIRQLRQRLAKGGVRKAAKARKAKR